jgi:hypothetical protein
LTYLLAKILAGIFCINLSVKAYFKASKTIRPTPVLEAKTDRSTDAQHSEKESPWLFSKVRGF